ncbi:cell wall-active antibiotics response protein LiaF [Paenibacillus dakarensis]|uniref:cell wall-active antibiotics response protein LiaF n=1 Tax=Paenibacillus dakarensis TaxID=1527293 RepID=UPI000AEA8675|nr:cell wall-active antibiotics response protein LiaF [Paenibacillus dakarensis]
MNRRGWNQLSGGLLLIGIGVFFILNQMGIIDVSLGHLISTFWPVILIWVGLQGFINSSDIRGAIWSSGVPLIIGLFFLGRNLDVIDFSFGEMIKYAIPVLLIGFGLTMLIGPKKHQPPHPPKQNSEDYIRVESMPEVPEAPNLESSLDEMFEQTFGKKTDGNQEAKPAPGPIPEEGPRYRDRGDYWKEDKWDHGETVNKSAFIGDVHMGTDYFTLKPTNISQFIGDTVLDLTKAQIPYGETKINISSFIGDVKVFVPNDSDLGVSVSTSSFIGDMKVLDQKRSGFMSNANVENPHYREAGKKLRINVSLFIGDVKVNKVG